MIEAGLLNENSDIKAEEYYKKQIPLIKERLKFLSDIPSHLAFFYKDKIDFKDKKELIPKKSTEEISIKALSGTYEALNDIEDFSEQNIEQALKITSEKLEIKIGQLFMPIRIAITGSKISPGLFESLNVLGKEKSLERILSAINYLKG